MIAESWIAIVAALFGGAGLKIIEKWLSRNTVKEDTATKLRTELREELTRLRTELDKTEKELDEYRTKYYNMMLEMSKVKIQLDEALAQIKKNADQAQKIINEAE